MTQRICAFGRIDPFDPFGPLAFLAKKSEWLYTGMNIGLRRESESQLSCEFRGILKSPLNTDFRGI